MEEYKLYLKKQPENGEFDRVHAVLVMQDGRILLRYKNGEARITGGHIDPGDASIEAALKRELLEEINCQIDKCAYLGYLEVEMKPADAEDGGLAESGTKDVEYWARMVARVSEIGAPQTDPDRAEKWVYGRTLAPAEIAKAELAKSAPLGDTDKLVDYALKIAREQEYFTELPNNELEVLNVEEHDL